MEKKKLKKLKINKMSEFPVIGDQEQMMMKGGYTIAEAEQMMDSGNWSGGHVDGLGYVGPMVTILIDGYTTQTCAFCDMQTYGQEAGGDAAAQAALKFSFSLQHYLGLHDNRIIVDTVYYGQ